MSARTQSFFKLLRIALASVVGSLLWAGCAQPRMAVVDPQAIAYAPVDLTRQRPDTHPELRTGLWQMRHANGMVANTVVSPSVRPPRVPEGTVDSASLLSYNPEVINAVPTGAEDSIIVEAAGAERPAERRTWKQRLQRRDQVPVAPPVQKREVIIEREIEVLPHAEPIPNGYRPSSAVPQDNEGGKLMDTYFVKRK